MPRTAQPLPTAPCGAASYLVELRGFEPLTPCMPCKCATNCATAPIGAAHSGQRGESYRRASGRLLIGGRGRGGGVVRREPQPARACLGHHRPAAVVHRLEAVGGRQRPAEHAGQRDPQRRHRASRPLPSPPRRVGRGASSNAGTMRVATSSAVSEPGTSTWAWTSHQRASVPESLTELLEGQAGPHSPTSYSRSAGPPRPSDRSPSPAMPRSHGPERGRW